MRAELSAAWPKGEPMATVEKHLARFKTDVFINRTEAKPRPYRFYVANFQNRRVLIKAITQNGGSSVANKEIDSADFVIDHDTRLYAKSHSEKTVCQPRFIAECLKAGRFLDVAAYHPDNVMRPPSRNTPISAPVSSLRQSVSMLSGNDQTNEDQEEEALDAEDRYVDDLLSSQSRNIAEYPSHMIDSPSAHSNISAAMSDNDFRIKQYLDTHSRNIRMLNSSENGRLQHRPAGTTQSFSFQQQQKQQQQDLRPTSQQSQRSHVSSMIERLTSPPQPPSYQDASNARNSNRIVRVPRASNSFQATRDVFEFSSPMLGSSTIAKANSFSPLSKARNGVSDAARDRRKTRTSPRRRQPETRLAHVNTQDNDPGNLSDLDNMGETAFFEDSPELIGSGFDKVYEPLLLDSAQSKPDNKVTNNVAPDAKSDGLNVIDLDDSSDDDYPEPSSFLAPRSNGMGSLSPELGSPPTAVAQRGQTFKQQSTPPMTADLTPTDAKESKVEVIGSNGGDSGNDALAEANAHAKELTHILNTPGKRRRVESSQEGYGHDALPVTIDKGHNLIKADGLVRRLSDSSTFGALPVDSSYSNSSFQPRTPLSAGAKRHLIKVKPWSPSKRIRISAADSSDPGHILEKENSSLSPNTAVSLPQDSEKGDMDHLQDDVANADVQASADSPAVLALQSSQSSHPLSAPELSSTGDSSKVTYVSQTPDDLENAASAEKSAEEVIGVSNDSVVSAQPSNPKQAPASADHSMATEDDEDGDYEFVDASEEQPRSRSQSLSQRLSQPSPQSQSGTNGHSLPENSNQPQQQQEQQQPSSTPMTISLSFADSDDESASQETPDVDIDGQNQPASGHQDAESSDSFEYTDESDEAEIDTPAVVPKEAVADSDDSDKEESEVEDVELEDDEKTKDEARQVDQDVESHGLVESEGMPEGLADTAVAAAATDSGPDTEKILSSESDAESGPGSDHESEPGHEAGSRPQAALDVSSVPEAVDAADDLQSSKHNAQADGGSAVDSSPKPVAASDPVSVADVVAARKRSRKESGSGEEIIEKWVPAVDVFDDDWSSRDAEVPLDESTGKLQMPTLTSSHPGPTTRSRARASLYSDEAPSHGRGLDLRTNRRRRMSSSRRLSMCQRLLQLQLSEQSGDVNKGGLGDSSNTGLGISLELGNPHAGEMALVASGSVAEASMPPSPARRATFSGTMRVFGDSEPEVSDRDRLQYMRRVKGLMEGTGLSAKEALNVLYFCTGDWVNARRHAVLGSGAVPAECLWNPKDDDILLQGHSARRMDELRRRRGKVEVYRRLQFLNAYHETGPR
ncbi:hypothetical protein FB645_000218 [Coemansia sp. IMI 203386]|nr:hypothetical protein FB645_000218 [Coemansia sp. IMI 203386]